MLKPFYQGKLDSFCAVYAVLNALRLTHGIRSSRAREFFNDTLESLARDPALFRAALRQETDYVGLVDALLAEAAKKMPLAVFHITTRESSPEDFLAACREWLAGDAHRAVVFRFMRFLKPEEKPLNRHWTVADRADEKGIHLFDCSHEAEAVLHIRKGDFVTERAGVDRERLVLIEPQHARFLRLPF